jgi:hypothetical protein
MNSCKLHILSSEKVAFNRSILLKTVIYHTIIKGDGERHITG